MQVRPGLGGPVRSVHSTRTTPCRLPRSGRIPVIDVLAGKRLGAVSASSGAEYLDGQHLAYQRFETLPDALNAVASGKLDGVVNSIGALQYLARTRFADTIAPPRGVLAPAYMAFALPINSALKRPLDRALTIVSASSEWRSVEDTYFGP